MITLVTGGSGSGKSEYAEQLILGYGECRRFYIATMEAFGEEGRFRVERHRRLREGKGFVTIEKQRNLEELAFNEDGSKAVLLECISNLAANEMFEGRYRGDLPGVEEHILKGIRSLAAQTEYLVVVTNEVGIDGVIYEKETMDYIRLMGRLNQKLGHLADRVVEVVYSIPVVWKEERA